LSFEFVEAGPPHLAVWFEPVVELHERLGAEAVEATLAVGTDCNQSCVAQNPQMFRDGWLAYSEPFYESLYRIFPTT
jgi:hypothetical protein